VTIIINQESSSATSIPMPAGWAGLAGAGAGEKPRQRPDMMQIEAGNTTG
jgi:hypothetical protein